MEEHDDERSGRRPGTRRRQKPGDAVFRALADPTRWQILGLLRGRQQTGGEIAGNFRMSRTAVSKHLRLLRGAGLVVTKQQATSRQCGLHAKPFESDLRPGGAWRMQLSGQRTNSSVSGEYREIHRPSLLSYTWNREQEEGPEHFASASLELTRRREIVPSLLNGLGEAQRRTQKKKASIK